MKQIWEVGYFQKTHSVKGNVADCLKKEIIQVSTKVVFPTLMHSLVSCLALRPLVPVTDMILSENVIIVLDQRAKNNKIPVWRCIDSSLLNGSIVTLI